MTPTAFLASLTPEPYIPPTSAPTQQIYVAPTIAPNLPTRTPSRAYEAYPYLVAEIVYGSQVTMHLKTGDVMYLSASHWVYGEQQCLNSSAGSTDKWSDTMCVFVHEAAKDEDITISSLLSGNAWLGVTDVLSPEQVVKNRMPFWWLPPNCDTGCKTVTVKTLLENGQFSDKVYTKP